MIFLLSFMESFEFYYNKLEQYVDYKVIKEQYNYCKEFDIIPDNYLNYNCKNCIECYCCSNCYECEKCNNCYECYDSRSVTNGKHENDDWYYD